MGSRWSIVVLALALPGCSCTPQEQQTANDRSTDQTSSPHTKQVESPPPGANAEPAGSAKSQKQPATAKSPTTAASNSDHSQPVANDNVGKSSAKAELFSPNAADETVRTSPDEAHKKATQLQAKAEQAAAAKRYGEAFQAVLEAWELVQSHSTDAPCRNLGAQLLQQLEHYGEQANRDSQEGPGASRSEKPLVIE